MALTLTASGGKTEKFSDFENGMYLLSLRSLKLTESTQFTNKDGTPKQQVECQFVLPEIDDPESGGPVEVRTWLGASLLPPDPNAKSDAGKKGSYLWKLVYAMTGHQVPWDESYDLETLINGQCRALVEIGEKGYPRINNSTFTSAQRRQPAQRPQPAVVAEPERKAADPKQIKMIRMAAEVQEVTEDALVLYVATHWGGATLDALSEQEAREVLDGIQKGEVPPF